jgi:hypothetical protein
MKRIVPAYALLLLGSLSLLAAGAPAPARPATGAPPAVCSLPGLKSAKLTPKPSFKSVIPPPCYAYTECPGGSSISCPNVSYDANCTSSDGCWVDCGQDGFLFCPGQENNPACFIY